MDNTDVENRIDNKEKNRKNTGIGGKRVKKNPKKTFSKKECAMERINSLFEQAQEMFETDTKLSDRYVSLARKIAMKYRISLPSRLKRQYCRHCYSFLMPGKNCRVRTTTKTISYFCTACKRYSRIGYKAKKKTI